MSNVFTEYDQTIDQAYMEEYLKDRAEHIPSGKLSASMLSKPLLWQILKTLGIERKEPELFDILKFKRGKDVEKEHLRKCKGLKEQQKNVEYRAVVGKIDAIVEYSGITYPLEVKSVQSSKFKWISKALEADDQYILQATLYGMAIKSEFIMIAVVDANFYRHLTFKYRTDLHARRIEGIIDAYNMCLKRKFMPVFEPLYKWQEKEEYQDYPEFSKLDQKGILDLLKSKYPTAYEKWVNL